MLAPMTVYWITTVVFTLQDVDVGNNAATVCYGRDNAYSCLSHEFQPKDTKGIPTSEWLGMFFNILLINVSTVQYRAPASYYILTSFTTILRVLSQLTRLPGL
jgi:hypothetical protein